MAPLGKKDGGRIGEDREKDSYKGTTAPVIELPKGGGALKGIDEKFSVNPSNGTSSFSFPLPFSPSRGPVPELVLNYNSGSGNGILGLGWSLSLSSIRRKTEQELPRYQDATDSDTYIFSGAEDLVPVIEKVGEKWKKKEQPDAGGKYTIRFYRPRIEGLFARIERWTKDSDGSIHWRVITKDNLTTIFGKDPAARIADPSDPLRIFEWFPQLVYDDKGHCVSYVYKKEDGEGIDKTAPHERNRLNGLAKYANTYLERIWYGNVQQYTPAMGDTLPAKFLFEAVFDYGEHDPDNPPFAETGKWLRRPDAFSGYRPGFEVRTYRRCERVLFYHHIDELPGGSALVRSVRFTYHDNSIDGFTFLGAITLTGYTKHAGGTYTHRSLPPFTFDYQRHEWNTEVRTIDPGSLVHAPAGISEPHYQWIDLFGEGVSGLLTEQAEGLFYKRNLGEGNFAPAQLVSPKPSFSRLQVSDLDSNNVRQLVQLEKEPKGFFAMEDDGSWLPFRPFAQLPNIDLQAANVKRLDLDGDGLTDVLVSEDDVFVWYPSKGTDGYGIPGRVAKTRDEEKGPAMVFSDPVQAILLADMSGDGLADLVRVRNGEICYWPNLGYGRFGAKVNMDNAPLFDTPDRFDPKLLRTADIDGSGTTDIVYLGRGAFSVWMNRQGNSFATAPVDIAPFPELSSSAQVSTLDLLGDGVSCIVWNCALPTHTGAPLRYIDLLNGKKPHLMTAYRDNAGKEVFLEYRSSTHYYFDDQQAGHQWITKLPFPVHCVSKTIAYDRIRKTRFASEYTYHHGFYDTHEREFRGFGRVEQTDAEQVEHFVKNSGGMMNNVVEDSLHQPPVLTKSWFHTGASLTGEKIHNGFAAEYYRNNQFTEYDMPGPQTGLAAATEDWREAQRACKGSLLRKEIYALDGSSEQDIPFVAEQHNLMVKVLQEKAINKHGVFFTHESESIAYHYEREPADPRVMHRFNLEVDAYGNLLRSAVVQYGRQGKDPDLVKEEQDVQSRLLLTCTRNDVTEAVTAPADDYRAPVTWQTRSYEITGNGPPSAAPYFTYADMDTATDPAEGTDLLYHETPSTGLERRLIEWVRTRFREDNGVAPLAFGKLRSKALVHETYKAAFSGALLDELFKTKTTDLLLGPVLIAATVEGGGYVKEDGHYWIPSGQQDYVAADFFLPSRFTDPFGKITKVEYGPYRLFAEKITDPMLNTVSVKQFSYRTLQPLRMEDANGNITAIRFDELGMVTAAFAAGKGADKGDVFDETNDEPSALDRPGAEFTYFIDEWYNQVQGGLDTNVYYKPHPNYAYTKNWEVHYNADNARSTEFLESYTYFDSDGKVLLAKVQAEPGEARRVKNDGTVEIVDVAGKRWIGNGRTILNNKGNPVKQYEPYFSVDATFDDEKEMVELGFTSVLHYDATGRKIQVVHANGSFAKTVFTAWKQTDWDENDTIATGDWNATMLAFLQALPAHTPDLLKRKLYRVAKHQEANVRSQDHSATPLQAFFDPQGRKFLVIADNKTQQLKTTTVFDSEGNVRVVKDASGRAVMRYDYDMLGNSMRLDSMDGGKRWSVNDVTGQPLLAYNDRGFDFSTAYDALRRPELFFVTEGGMKKTFARIVYGEGAPDDTANNLRGRPWKQYDQAGLVVNTSYDFKGNLLSASRQLCSEYRQTIDWQNIAAVAMDGDPFVSVTAYDALNRPVSLTPPHRAGIPASTVFPGYNLAGQLETLKADLRSSGTLTEFVTNIDYNAKRQREAIVYKNGTRTGYEYDPFSFRLTGLKTTRATPAATLQDIIYTYDPVGNITDIRDDAQDDKVYNGEDVKPENRFLYDALYRLVQAEGRKHAGQCLPNHGGVSNDFRNHPFIASPDPNDVNAICNYRETYRYDAGGNLEEQKHISAKFPWTRTFSYGIAAGDNKNNRLKETGMGGPAMAYDYDAHGNLTKLEHLPDMRWNFSDHFCGADLPGGRNVFYVYDSSGERVRKVIHDDMDRKVKERIYLGGFELYREYTVAGAIGLERESLHIMDDQHRVALVETLTREKSADIAGPVPLQRYQYDNHLGSASLELDESGAIITYEEYFPFGLTSYQSGRSEKEVKEKRYRYTGKERDQETGLAYHSARYYAPWLCRWTACDPIGIKDGTNRYLYTKNNPVNRIDPAGTEDQPPPVKKPPPPDPKPEPKPDAGGKPDDKGNVPGADSGTLTPPAPLKPDFIGGNVILPKSIFEVLQKQLGKDAAGIRSVKAPRVYHVTKPDGKKEKVGIPKGYVKLEVDQNFSPTDNPLYFRMIKEIAQSGEKVLFGFSTGTVNVAMHRQVLPAGKMETIAMNDIMRQAGLTLPSQDLQKKVHGSLVDSEGVKTRADGTQLASSVTSHYKDVSMLYLSTIAADGKTAIHEFLGHFYLAVKGAPFGHSSTILEKHGIIGVDGKPFAGTGTQFIDQITAQYRTK